MQSWICDQFWNLTPTSLRCFISTLSRHMQKKLFLIQNMLMDSLFRHLVWGFSTDAQWLLIPSWIDCKTLHFCFIYIALNKMNTHLKDLQWKAFGMTHLKQVGHHKYKLSICGFLYREKWFGYNPFPWVLNGALQRRHAKQGKAWIYNGKFIKLCNFSQVL